MKWEISVKDWSIGLLQIVLHTGTCGIHLAPKDVFITGNSDQTIYGGSLRRTLKQSRCLLYQGFEAGFSCYRSIFSPCVSLPPQHKQEDLFFLCWEDKSYLPQQCYLAVEAIWGQSEWLWLVSVFHLHDTSEEGHRRSHQHSLFVSSEAFKTRDVGCRTVVWDQPGDHRADHQTQDWERTFIERRRERGGAAD